MHGSSVLKTTHPSRRRPAPTMLVAPARRPRRSLRPQTYYITCDHSHAIVDQRKRTQNNYFQVQPQPVFLIFFLLGEKWEERGAAPRRPAPRGHAPPPRPRRPGRGCTGGGSTPPEENGPFFEGRFGQDGPAGRGAMGVGLIRHFFRTAGKEFQYDFSNIAIGLSIRGPIIMVHLVPIIDVMVMDHDRGEDLRLCCGRCVWQLIVVVLDRWFL